MNEIKIESYVYNNAPLTLKKDIAELLDIYLGQVLMNQPTKAIFR